MHLRRRLIPYLEGDCMPHATARAFTTGLIRKVLAGPDYNINASLSQINHVIQTRGIKPIGRAGHYRLFSDADVAHIASELRRIGECRINY